MDRLKRLVSSVFHAFGLEIRRRPRLLPSELAHPLDDEHTSADYDSIWQCPGFVRQYLDSTRRAFLKEVVELCQQERVLDHARTIVDIGCGPGYLLSLIAELNTGAQLVGSDFSSEALLAARRYCPVACFFQHDIYKPLPSSYDVIVCTEVLEHLLYPREALDNLARAGRALVVTVPDGRRDTCNEHINFWSEASWKVFLEPYEREWRCKRRLSMDGSKIITICVKRHSSSVEEQGV